MPSAAGVPVAIKRRAPALLQAAFTELLPFRYGRKFFGCPLLKAWVTFLGLQIVRVPFGTPTPATAMTLVPVLLLRRMWL